MTSRLALFRGDDRYQNIIAALDAIHDDVDLRGIDRVLVKPNFVVPDCPPAATHVDAVRAVLDWLRARTDVPIVVGEGTASSSTWRAFENYGYLSLPDAYRDVSLMDLNDDQTVELAAFDRRLRPMPLKASRTLVTSPLRISVGPPKTHDTVLVTLSLKNMIMGGLSGRSSPNGRRPPEVDPGPAPEGLAPKGALTGLLKRLYLALPERLRYNPPLEWAKMVYMTSFKPSSKKAMHQSFPVMNLNLFTLAPFFYPHLAVIDGFEAMEGDGPTHGEAVDWHLALAGTDWLAADATTARLMGFELEEIGYLVYCARAGYGTVDPDAIQVVGNARLDDVARRFKRHGSAHVQRRWESRAVSRHLRRTLAVGD